MHKFTSLASLESKLVLFTTILISALGFFSATAVDIAIPSIQKDFSASIGEIQWIITSFILAVSILILIAGSLSDKFGYKKLLIFGATLFTISTFLCGLAPTPLILIILRIFQGIGAAFMIPQSLAIINVSFSDEIKGHAIGIWGGMSSGIIIFAPIISGFLVDIGGWRVVFFSLIPLSLVSIFFVSKFISENVQHLDTQIDWVGIILATVSLFLLCLGFINISRSLTFDIQNLVLIISGSLILIAFIVFELKSSSPLINFKALSEREVVIANIFTILMYTTISMIAFFIPLYIQQVLNKSASMTGLVMLPLSIAITILSFFTGKLGDKYGTKVMMGLGSFMVGLGGFPLLLLDESFKYALNLFPSMLLMGIGFGIFIPALSKAALAVDEKYSGMASGFNNSISRISGLIAVVVFGMVLVFSFRYFLAENLDLSQHLNSYHSNYVYHQVDKLLEIDIETEFSESETKAMESWMNESFIEAIKIQALAIILISFISSVICLIYLPKNNLNRI